MDANRDRRRCYGTHARAGARFRPTEPVRSVALKTAGTLLLSLCLFSAGCGGGGGGGEGSDDDPQPSPTPVVTATAPQPTASLPLARAWAVGTRQMGGLVVRSEDGGATWATVLTPNTPLGGVIFINRDQGWTVGGNVILHTEDGGDSWEDQSGNIAPLSGPPFLSRVAFSSNTRGIAVGGSFRAGQNSGPPLILTTSDGGMHWTAATLPTGENPALRVGSLQDVCLTSTGSALAVGSGYGGVVALFSHDAGASWSDITQDIGSLLPVLPSGVACVGSSDFWIVGDGSASIVHSSDGGATWSNQVGNAPGGGNGLYGVAFADLATGWVAGRGATILHTVDRGESWTPQPLTGAQTGDGLLAISFATPDAGTVVGVNESDIQARSAVAFFTRDGGVTWASSALPIEVLLLRDVSAVP